jgi:uncharacterized membrane protein
MKLKGFLAGFLAVVGGIIVVILGGALIIFMTLLQWAVVPVLWILGISALLYGFITEKSSDSSKP